MLLPVFVICTLRLLSHCSNKIHTIKIAQFLSFKTGCSYPRITVSSWCPDQDIRNYYPKILNYFGIIIINRTKEGVPPQLTRRRAPTRASPPQLTRRRAPTRASPPQLTRRRAPTRASPPQLTRRRAPTRASPPQLTRRRATTRAPPPPATHAQTKVSPHHSHRDESVHAPSAHRRGRPPPRFTRRRRCSPRHSRTDEGVPPAIHIQTKGVPPPHTCRRQCPYIPPLARQTRKKRLPK